MKWIRRVLFAIAVLACALLAYVLSTSLRTARPVGFQGVQAAGADGKPFVIGVWYPADARPWPTLKGLVLMNVARDAPIAGRGLPMVVISHGNGGGPLGHADLALSLANAGYIVAAPMHHGDNVEDQSAVGSPVFFSGRTLQLRATVDHMLKTWQGRDRIDPDRIGAFGFSMGGFTVLTAVGAQPDLRIIPRHCAESPEFACEVLRNARSPFLQPGASAVDFEPDPRIKAAVVAAPGFGFTMARTGPDAVRVPVQLWSADKDDSVPYATNAGLVRAALGPRVEFHSVSGAGHFSFLTPCSILAPRLPICAEQGAFDRGAFHESMNASVLAFFNKNLKGP